MRRKVIFFRQVIKYRLQCRRENLSAVWEELSLPPYFSAIVEILKNPSVSGLFRFLSKVGDGMMKMRIVRIEF